MPELQPLDAEYLSILFDAGPAKSGFSGPTSLEWFDLQAFCNVSGEVLSSIEARLIRTLSIVYCNATHSMSEHDARSPWLESQEEYVTEKLKSAETGMAAIFRTMSKKG